MTEQTYTPPQGPPRKPIPRGIYDFMGQEKIFAMVAAFYEALGRSPIAHLFPQDPEALRAASERSAAFFVQILGGPTLYNLQFGPPKMRSKHLPFRIDEEAKNHWLSCFFGVLEEAPARFGFPASEVEPFCDWLSDFASWMVNVPPSKEATRWRKKAVTFECHERQ